MLSKDAKRIARRKKESEDNLRKIRKKIKKVTERYKFVRTTLLICSIVLVGTYLKKGALPDHKEINHHLLKQPIQTAIDEKRNIDVTYRGGTYEIDLVQHYEINGLVVSKNNIEGIGDIYHDEDSFDTRDLCLIWGSNLLSNDYNAVKFYNVSVTCNWTLPHGIDFNNQEVSNNHLITDSKAVRKKIQAANVGDQVKITGFLSNYSQLGIDFKRNSSLTRTDTGMGACEVLFVNEFKTYKRGTPLLYLIYNFMKYFIIFLVILFSFYFIKLTNLNREESSEL